MNSKVKRNYGLYSRPIVKSLYREMEEGMWSGALSRYMEQEEQVGVYALALLAWVLGETDSPNRMSFIETIRLFWGLSPYSVPNAISMDVGGMCWQQPVFDTNPEPNHEQANSIVCPRVYE